SHTILSLCVFASAAFMVARYLKNSKTLKTILGTASIVLAVLTVVFRAFSGVHWFTDIIGGVFLSLALLNMFLAFLPGREL
ncbi:MAG: phosphatase PAP2 family protein, partial [Lachnospiraceae bacterium]|nr:phosphatase PAP2 family protein [Lachnospiraceae bacterium]